MEHQFEKYWNLEYLDVIQAEPQILNSVIQQLSDPRALEEMSPQDHEWLTSCIDKTLQTVLVSESFVGLFSILRKESFSAAEEILTKTKAGLSSVTSAFLDTKASESAESIESIFSALYPDAEERWAEMRESCGLKILEAVAMNMAPIRVAIQNEDWESVSSLCKNFKSFDSTNGIFEGWSQLISTNLFTSCTQAPNEEAFIDSTQRQLYALGLAFECSDAFIYSLKIQEDERSLKYVAASIGIHSTASQCCTALSKERIDKTLKPWIKVHHASATQGLELSYEKITAYAASAAAVKLLCSGLVSDLTQLDAMLQTPSAPSARI